MGDKEPHSKRHPQRTECPECGNDIAEHEYKDFYKTGVVVCPRCDARVEEDEIIYK